MSPAGFLFDEVVLKNEDVTGSVEFLFNGLSLLMLFFSWQEVLYDGVLRHDFSRVEFNDPIR